MPDAWPSRASKRELRAWAWIAGGLAFLAPAAVLGAAPEPPRDAAPASGERPDILIRRVTRRIVITQPAAPAPARYVVSAGSASGGSGTSSSSSSTAATSTGGS